MLMLILMQEHLAKWRKLQKILGSSSSVSKEGTIKEEERKKETALIDMDERPLDALRRLPIG